MFQCLILCSVMSKKTQFTLTEATRTLNVGEAPQLPNAENGLWIGCGGLDREQAICQVRVAIQCLQDKH